MIANFDEVNELENVGNKAKFLIMMKKAGFQVPNGVVLDSNTYKEILQDNQLENTIKQLLQTLNTDNVSKVSAEIISYIDTMKISQKIQEQVLACIDSRKLYAVRSSGTKEDLDSFSFAGQYETFLNVPASDIFSKIKKCYKSIYSEIILNYLLNNKISTDELGMTVILQEMVPSDFSGVCFTINPISGNDKEMLIEVGEGLGENIVSGKVTPEQYAYNWYEHTYHYDSTNKYISKELLDDMTETFLNIQLFFGYPCDVEFGIFQNQLYILQARKITKIKYLGIQDIWTTADFKDGGVSATVCTPFMWSLYEYIWEFSLKKFILDSKILKEQEIPNKLGEMFYARCYWNLSCVKKAMSKVVGYKEREFDSEYGIKINYTGDGEVTNFSLQSTINIIRMALAQNKILKTRNENAEYYKRDLLEKYNNYKEAYDKNAISDIKSTWYHLIKKDYLQSETTYFWQIFINTIHQSLYKDGLLKYVSESDYLTLLGSIENISHLLPFYDMWSISRMIRNDEKAFTYWKNSNTEELIQKIKTENGNQTITAIKKLIADYGYHSDKELDVTYPCYYEDISPLIITLKDMILLEDNFSPIEDKKKGKAEYLKILASIESQVSKQKYLKIKDKVEKMRKMLWWREEFRDVSTRFYYIIRIYTLDLAKELEKENVLAHAEDIWFLKIENLWDFLDKKISIENLKEIIINNKTYYNAYKNYMSENEIGQIFKDAQPETNNNSTDGIKGLGANNGKVIGTARVIESFDEIDRLQKNDILVTKFTDTGWTPKFAILSGIVTEYGGILCHAAIVSREYGIPAIVSCHNVMSKIQDGQKIMIDGTTGTVTILS